MIENSYVSAALGIVVSAASASIGWLTLRWSASRPGLFIAAISGGVALRLLLVVAASVLLLMFTATNPGAYAAGLVVTYLAFLGLEIAMFARRGSGQGKKSNFPSTRGSNTGLP
ncbi:MAG: hypothetical protein VX733_14605 [Candidatus Latescibacterota bacterium]|nr:hypothetical protein [Candidatus Latescibacterota bacterium]